MKIQENDKNCKKVGIKEILKKNSREILNGTGQLSQMRALIKMEVWFGFQDLNPSERKSFRLNVQRDRDSKWFRIEERLERERECLNSSVNTQFQEDLSVDATEDLMMRICY